MEDHKALLSIVSMIDRLNRNYAEMGTLIRTIDEEVTTVIQAHDAELREHRRRIANIEEDVSMIKKKVGICS